MQKTFEISTNKKQEIIDITEQVRKVVKESGIKEGICVVYTAHATAGVIINENYDPNICTDLINCLNKLIPQGKWLHDRIDDNADAHLKSAIIGPSETIVVEKGELVLGTWQSIMVADFDGPRRRRVVVKIVES